MKLNEKSLSLYAGSGAPPDREGVLLKRGDLNKGFQKRWCVLKGNLLFYYEKRTDKDPIGLIVLEGCTIELSDLEDGFTFMIQFPGAGARTYILAANTQEEMEAWMKAMSCASYDYMKVCVNELKSQLLDLETNTTKKLLQSAMEDNLNISSGFSHPKMGKKSASPFNQARRLNPFDLEESFEEDNYDSGNTKARTFLEMHEEYRQQFTEISADWLQQQRHSGIPLKQNDLITV